MGVAMGLHFGLDAAYQHSVVFDHEFAGNRALPLRNGGYDYNQVPAQGHCAIQRRRQCRRSTGRVRMEARSRCV